MASEKCLSTSFSSALIPLSTVLLQDRKRGSQRVTVCRFAPMPGERSVEVQPPPLQTADGSGQCCRGVSRFCSFPTCWRFFCINSSCPAKWIISWAPWRSMEPVNKGCVRAEAGPPAQAADTTPCSGPYSAGTVHQERREARRLSVPQPGTGGRAWLGVPSRAATGTTRSPGSHLGGSAAAVQKALGIGGAEKSEGGKKKALGAKKASLYSPAPNQLVHMDAATHKSC